MAGLTSAQRDPDQLPPTVPVRHNPVIERLEHGDVVFGGGMVWTGNIDEAMAFADLGYDFVIFEMEHEGFHLPSLRLSLQFLLERRRIVGGAGLAPDVVPLVRIPPNAREHNQWIIKQSLDAGVYGLVVPHLDTVEQARAAVVASRYPQVPGAPDFEPAGERGWWYRLAPRYWGLTPEEYYEAADLWPLDPAGDMLLMPIVESVQGIRNLADILANEKGIGAIWAGPADLAVEIGARGNVLDPRVEEGVEEILRTCRRFNIPCAIKAGPAEVEQRIDQGFRIIVSSPARVDRALELGRKAAAR